MGRLVMNFDILRALFLFRLSSHLWILNFQNLSYITRMYTLLGNYKLYL